VSGSGPDLTRRGWLAGGVVAPLALVGCSVHPPRSRSGERSGGPASYSLADALDCPTRLPGERARDAWRHPRETLTFFGLKPGMTVIELWPGGGWYTAILAPWLARNGGRLIAAGLETQGSQAAAATRMMAAYRQRLSMHPDLYGKVEGVEFGPRSGPLGPPASADMVLTFRNIHNWMGQGFVDKAMRDIAAVLKPGGIFGVEEHRAAAGSVQDPTAPTGYVTEAYVKALAAEVGLRFDGASEINANPRDTRDHPFGVWTLPPSRQSAPNGKPENLLFDHRKYDSIGESDRMTLRFVKPPGGLRPSTGGEAMNAAKSVD
jgi:predicted methyltransferase